MFYEIVIRGYILESRFEGLTIIRQPDFTTNLSGFLVDQSALYGILRTINDLGLDLISVKLLEDETYKKG